MNKIFAILVLVLFFAGIANASMIRMPDTVILEESAKEIVISVDNETPVKQPLNVELFVPVRYEIYDKPGWVYPGERVRFTVRFIPRSDLTGLVYESKAVVTLGVLKEEKDFTLEFREANRCNIEATVKKTAEDSEVSEVLVYEIKFVNKGIDAQNIEMIKVTGIPAEWGYEFDSQEITVVPGMSSLGRVTLVPNGNYEGTATVSFKCGNYGDFGKEFGVNHLKGGDAGEGNDLNNITILGLGMLDFEAIDLSMNLPEGTELVIDIVLAMIVIVLIVAVMLKLAKVK